MRWRRAAIIGVRCFGLGSNIWVLSLGYYQGSLLPTVELARLAVQNDQHGSIKVELSCQVVLYGSFVRHVNVNKLARSVARSRGESFAEE